MAEPGTSIESAIDAGDVEGEYTWLADHPCECGDPWQLVRQALMKKEETTSATRITDRLDVRCDDCGQERSLFFVVSYPREDDEP